MRNLLAGALLLASASAVNAAECEFPFGDVVGSFAAAGARVAIIPETELAEVVDKTEELFGLELGEATRGFFAVAGGKVLLGLEVDGCLLEPVVVGSVTRTGERLSGKDKETGKIGA